ncbi:hypothetical protein BGZ98_010021 [Dissophora globulifera]|nr:hypothetical protein BGZ98_010021 [Dissophora globulifera]
MSKNGIAVILPGRAQALANYPHARVVNGTIYVSGISSRRLDNTYEGVKELSDGTLELDIKAQTKAVIENIGVILESQGASLANIVDMTVFLTNMNDYGAMNEVSIGASNESRMGTLKFSTTKRLFHPHSVESQVYNQYFNSETGPSRTCVGVLSLPSPKLLIEIKAIALAP